METGTVNIYSSGKIEYDTTESLQAHQFNIIYV